MMPNVTTGGRTTGLLIYLTGPGRANEHTDQHLVAGDSALMAWHGDDELDRDAAVQIAQHLDAPMHAFGTEVLGGIYEYDETSKKQVKVGVGPAHVWHCSLSLRADEGQISDELWGQIATEFVEEMGFGDEDGSKAPCRWAAVRHGLSKNGNDHIHIVVNRVREDGTKASDWQRFKRSQKVVAAIERRHGLQILESREAGRSLPGVSPAEQQLQKRTGAPEPDRTRLHRLVRAAATQAGDEGEFVRRARRAGLMVRPRYAAGRSDVVTGYSVALRPTAGARPVWFGGGQLARDLTLPRLREYWPDTPEAATAAVAEWNAAHRGQRVVAPGAEVDAPAAGELAQMTQAMRDMRQRLARIDPSETTAWTHIARQAAGLLSTWSTATEAEPGPLAHAARELATIASTHARCDRAVTPMRSTFQGLALSIAGLHPRTPGAMRAAILMHQVIVTVQALAGALRAGNQLATAERLHAIVNQQLAPVREHLHREAAARAATSSPARAAVATATAQPAAEVGGPNAELMERLRVTDPDAWRAAVLRQKVYGRMGSPVSAPLRPRAPTPARRATTRGTERDTGPER